MFTLFTAHNMNRKPMLWLVRAIKRSCFSVESVK